MTMESSYRIVRETSVYPCQQETYPRRLNAMPAPVRRTAATRPPIRPMTLPVWGSVDTGVGFGAGGFSAGLQLVMLAPAHGALWCSTLLRNAMFPSAHRVPLVSVSTVRSPRVRI